MKKEKICGNCKYMECEGKDGWGWCTEYEDSVHHNSKLQCLLFKENGKNRLSALVMLLVWAVFMILIFLAYVDAKQNRILKNQRYIEQILIELEQSQNFTDSAVVDLYQKLNELWYDSKGIPGKAQ